jgi:hypothetical protein
MSSIIRNASRRLAAPAIVAAVCAAGLSATAPAAGTQQATKGCNPSYERCEINYTYYTDYHRTVVTGHGTKDCDGNVTVWDGYATTHFYYEAFPCPL